MFLNFLKIFLTPCFRRSRYTKYRVHIKLTLRKFLPKLDELLLETFPVYQVWFKTLRKFSPKLDELQ